MSLRKQEEILPLKRLLASTPVATFVHETVPLELPSPSPVLHSLPSLTPAASIFAATTRSTRPQKKCPDLQRSSLDGLLGHQPEILFDFLRAPSPFRKTIAALTPPLCDSANLLSRSWNEKEQSFLNEMPLVEAIVIAQLYSHRSILMAVADKVHYPSLYTWILQHTVSNRFI